MSNTCRVLAGALACVYFSFILFSQLSHEETRVLRDSLCNEQQRLDSSLDHLDRYEAAPPFG